MPQSFSSSAEQHSRMLVRFERPTVLALLALTLALGVGLALPLDLAVARWVSQERLPGELRTVVRLSEVFAFGWSALLVLLAAAALDPRCWKILPRLALGAYGAGLLANLLKVVLGRTRPAAFDINLSVWESFLGLFAWRNAQSLTEALSRDGQSFPSGHAATAAGLACALSRLYPRGTWFFGFLAALACYQRIDAGAHYLSDVLAGACLGVLVNLVLELPRYRQRLARLEGIADC